MSKIDITVSKQITINTGNYSSVRPSVSVTLKDVEAEDLAKEYSSLEQAVDGLFSLEISKLIEQQDAMNSIPVQLKRVADGIKREEDAILEEVENLMK